MGIWTKNEQRAWLGEPVEPSDAPTGMITRREYELLTQDRVACLSKHLAGLAEDLAPELEGLPADEIRQVVDERIRQAIADIAEE